MYKFISNEIDEVNTDKEPKSRYINIDNSNNALMRELSKEEVVEGITNSS
jgi:hypothetical protein